MSGRKVIAIHPWYSNEEGLVRVGQELELTPSRFEKLVPRLATEVVKKESKVKTLSKELKAKTISKSRSK